MKEFVLRMKDSSGRGENTVLFRETLMPEAGPVRDGELSRTDRPLLDAYFFFGKGSTADVVVNMGSCRFEDGNGKYTTCTYQSGQGTGRSWRTDTSSTCSAILSSAIC